ncbi:MAG: cupin domain-containing protein [Solirubrobacterales bacterium]
MASRVPPGCEAPPRHIHSSDQTYYVLSGEMQLELGEERYTVGPETAVFIPAGVPHHNWNEGDEDEIHLEFLVPGIHPMDPLMTPVESTDPQGLPYAVVPVPADGYGDPARLPAGLDPSVADPNFGIQVVTERKMGSQHHLMYVGKVDPGAGGPPLHVHEFDQFYYVLEGRLSVEIGFETFVAEPNSLVVLPAGVPHRQWNDGPEIERHIAVNIPEGEAGTEWDVPVRFAVAERR